MPAWDLGKLLGFSEPPAAWLVVTTSDQPDAPEIAIGTGPCIAVAAHDGAAPLPGGVVVGPEAAVIGVFATDPALRERGDRRARAAGRPVAVDRPGGARRGAAW